MTLLFIYLAIAIGVSFLCSVLEAVLLSVTPSYVENVQKKRPKAAAHLVRVKENLDESLSSILILNTFAHTMGAAGVGSQALQVFGPQWETPIAIILTLIILYFSEIIPKTLGATFWQQLATPSAFVISLLVKLVYPLVWLSTRLTRLFSRHKENEITREEIIALASLGHKEGILFPHENTYLSNLLNLREIKTEKILTPRTVVHMLDESISVEEALLKSKERQFSRIPIYTGNMDNVNGQVFLRDLYKAAAENNEKALIKDFMHPVFRISEKLSVQKLLDMFIKKRAHLFIVEDEYGQVEGIVTLEDAIETLLGREIIDEHDTVVDMQELAKIKFREKLRNDKINPDLDDE
jgi:CBS domain containing-hemolysin-like protein